MFSDTSRVMFIKSPAFARDEFELLLYNSDLMVGMFLSIVTGLKRLASHGCVLQDQRV